MTLNRKAKTTPAHTPGSSLSPSKYGNAETESQRTINDIEWTAKDVLDSSPLP